MKKEYDFSKGRRGAVLRVPPGKTRVTIRLDDDILDWFRQQVDDAGGGNYQTLINDSLRSFMRQKQESLETTLRRKNNFTYSAEWCSSIAAAVCRG